MEGRNIQQWPIPACLNRWIVGSFLVGSSLFLNDLALAVQKKEKRCAWVNKKSYWFTKAVYNFACITLWLCTCVSNTCITCYLHIQDIYKLLIPTHAESWRKKRYSCMNLTCSLPNWVSESLSMRQTLETSCPVHAAALTSKSLLTISPTSSESRYYICMHKKEHIEHQKKRIVRSWEKWKRETEKLKRQGATSLVSIR